MKRKLLMILFLIFLSLFSGYVVFADDDDHDRYREHEEEEWTEEAGETLGWGAIAFAGGAGLLFPLRRGYPRIVKFITDKQLKKRLSMLLKWVAKWHVPAGILALMIASVHGITMFLAEGELEGEGILGLAGLILMILAGLFGAYLTRKKQARRVRNIHIGLLLSAGLLILIHIAAS